jgi:hypothetical protein
VTHTEGVILTLGHSRKAADALVLAIGMKLCLASGKDLVSVGLVSDIPDYLVIWSIIHIMEGNGKLYHSETGTKVTRVVAYLFNDMLPELVTESHQVKPVELPEVLRSVDSVKQPLFF